MSTRKEIIFSARDGGVESTIAKLKRSSNELGRGLLRDAMDQSKTAKDAIRNYEDQIKLIERRNRLSNKQSRLEATSSRDAALSSANNNGDKSKINQKYSDQMKSLDKGSKEDQIQIELLRELIQTVQSTSSQQINSSNSNSSRQRSSVERAMLEDAGDEFVDLADRYHEESSGTDGKRKEGRKGSGSADKLKGGLIGIAQSESGEGALSKTLELGKGHLILGAIAAAAGVGLNGLNVQSKREESAGRMAAITGSSTQGILDSRMGSTAFMNGYGPNTLGVSREEFLSGNLPNSVRAAGTSKGAFGNAMRSLEIDKSLDLDGGTGDSLSKLARVMGGSNKSLANQVYSSMSGTGAFGDSNKDMARMNEIMQGFVGFQEGEFNRTGSTEGGGTMRMMRGLQNLGGNFERSDYAMSTIQGVNSGLQQGGTAEAQSIKFDILRKQNPNKSFFELQQEMEKGVNSEGYLEGVMQFVKGTGGDQNTQSLLMDSLMGGNVRKSDISAMISGDLSLEDYKSQSINHSGRAAAASSGAKEEFLKLEETFKDVLAPIGKNIEQAVKHMKDLVNRMEK